MAESISAPPRVPAWKDAERRLLWMWCNPCGRPHTHGACDDITCGQLGRCECSPRAGEGHRVAHCSNWPNGYVLVYEGNLSLDDAGPGTKPRTSTPTAKTTTLYRMFDGANQLLYVGIAGNPGRRFEQHARGKAWWAQVARVDTEHFESRKAARAAEKRAIKSESPIHNVVHNGKNSKEGDVAMDSTAGGGLIGTYFVSYDDDGKLNWQGRIEYEAARGIFMVLTYSWMNGGPYAMRLVRLDDMLNWNFYDEHEWFMEAARNARMQDDARRRRDDAAKSPGATWQPIDINALLADGVDSGD